MEEKNTAKIHYIKRIRSTHKIKRCKMRKFRIDGRMLGCLLGMLLFCYLPTYSFI